MSGDGQKEPVREDLVSSRQEAAGFILDTLRSEQLLAVRGISGSLKLAARYNVELVDVFALARERAEMERAERQKRFPLAFRAGSLFPNWYYVANGARVPARAMPEGTGEEWSEIWRTMMRSPSSPAQATFRRCAMRRLPGGRCWLWSPRGALVSDDIIDLSEDEGRDLLAQIARILDLHPAAADEEGPR